MVPDNNGNGQFVQQSLIESNSEWHFEQLIAFFQSTHEKWREVRVIVVDKDLKEVNVLMRMFPDARVVLCHFHVLKYLAEHITKKTEKFGAYSEEDLTNINHEVYAMVYAQDEAAYEKAFAGFREKTCANNSTAFFKYIVKNWAPVTDMWVDYKRQDIPHFKNKTTNCLESNFGVLKLDSEPHDTMRESMECIDRMQRRVEDHYAAEAKHVGTRVDRSLDLDLNYVLNLYTPWVVDTIKSDYQFVRDGADCYNVQQDTERTVVVVSTKGKEYVVDKEAWLCNCALSTTCKLPCRHVFWYRKHEGIAPTIPVFSINERWKSIAVEDTVVKTDAPFQYKCDMTFKPEYTKEKILAPMAKYNMAMRIASRICSEMGDLPQAKFCERMEELKALHHSIRMDFPAAAAAAARDAARDALQSQLRPYLRP